MCWKRVSAALAENLASKELREELIAGLVDHLNTENLRSSERSALREKEREQNQVAITSARIERDNLVRAISQAGHSRALLDALAQVEARLLRLEELLSEGAPQEIFIVTEEQVRSFVEKRSAHFAEILSAEPQMVKHELQKRMSVLTLTPEMREGQAVYRVTGDVSLFSAPEGVVQNNQVHPIALHYTIPVRLILPIRISYLLKEAA